MANLISGKLPPEEGMAEEAFYDYALYLSLREFLRVRQGAEDVRQLDASYSQGRRINQGAILQHPIGNSVAQMGRAFHEGAVLPGWNCQTGKMDWGQYASFVRWYAALRPAHQSIVLSRIREGSETPWAPVKTEQPAAPECAGVVPEKTLGPKMVGGEQGTGTVSQQLATRTAPGTVGIAKDENQESPLGTIGWVAILAIIASAGALIYRALSYKKTSAETPNEEERATT